MATSLILAVIVLPWLWLWGMVDDGFEKMKKLFVPRAKTGNETMDAEEEDNWSSDEDSTISPWRSVDSEDETTDEDSHSTRCFLNRRKPPGMENG